MRPRHQFLLINLDGSMQFIDPIDSDKYGMLYLHFQSRPFERIIPLTDPTAPTDEMFRRGIEHHTRLYQRVRTDISLGWIEIFVQRE